MKSKAVVNITIILCVFLCPMAIGQGQQSKEREKDIILELSKATPNARMSQIAVARIATASSSKSTSGIKARMRLRGKDVAIEFLASLSSQAKEISIASDIPLDDIGEDFCVISSGVYRISYDASKNGSFSAHLKDNLAAADYPHRRRKSKKGC